MLWVLKRTVSLRRFFWAPKTFAKKYGLEIIYNFMLNFLDDAETSESNKETIFLFLNKNLCCGYSKELSQWNSSFEHSKHLL